MNLANPDRKNINRTTIWVRLIVFNLFIVAIACTQAAVQSKPDAQKVVTQIDGPANVAADAVRFEAIDVFVSLGKSRLAAYQLELNSTSPGVEIVGIEGGDHAAFAAPPYYDTRAMNNNRVILAAFSTAKELPAQRCRIARIHLQLEGPGRKEYHTKLSVSADASGDNIPAEIEVVKAKA